MYPFLNIGNLCRYARFLQAQSHLLLCEQIKVHNMDIATYIIIINYKYMYTLYIYVCAYICTVK